MQSARVSLASIALIRDYVRPIGIVAVAEPYLPAKTRMTNPLGSLRRGITRGLFSIDFPLIPLRIIVSRLLSRNVRNRDTRNPILARILSPLTSNTARPIFDPRVPNRHFRDYSVTRASIRERQSEFKDQFEEPCGTIRVVALRSHEILLPFRQTDRVLPAVEKRKGSFNSLPVPEKLLFRI